MSHLQNKSRPLSEPASLLLDVIRFTAAILVVITHFTLPEFHTGFSKQQHMLGDIAVPVFFVLSGFVIRYVTLTREHTPRVYFIDRASRMYSVVLPSMLFTLIAGGICFLINRDEFLRNWSSTFSHPLSRLVFNLTFLSQAWGHNTTPFGNIPFWSLGYECVYYAIYGFILFFRGWTRALLCLVAAITIGPQVVFLFPVWWLGCWIYDVYIRLRGTRSAQVIVVISLIWLAISTIFFFTGNHRFLLAPINLFLWISNLPNPLAALGIPVARATMFAVATGVVFSLFLFVILLGVDNIDISPSSRWAKPLRNVANGTFSIYLFHYPFLMLLLFLGLLRTSHPGMNILVAAGMCVILIVIAIPMDGLKRLMRQSLLSSTKRQRSDTSAPRTPIS
jgi:peptidoglycan/LPS O-acetylase OafA/YrhL